MPSKGQSCMNCDANCCHSVVAFRYPPEAESRHKAAAEVAAAKGETYFSTATIMDYSYRQLLAFGMEEVKRPVTGKACPHLTAEGRCKLHGKNKPRLCSSYWCNGRLWQPRAN